MKWMLYWRPATNEYKVGVEYIHFFEWLCKNCIFFFNKSHSIAFALMVRHYASSSLWVVVILFIGRMPYGILLLSTRLNSYHHTTTLTLGIYTQIFVSSYFCFLLLLSQSKTRRHLLKKYSYLLNDFS